MKRTRVFLMTVVALFAIGAIGATTAQAGTGHINAKIGFSTYVHCDITFVADTPATPDFPGSLHTGAGYTGYRTLYDLEIDTSPGKSCGFSGLEGEIHAHWKANGTTQWVVSLTQLEFVVFGFPENCPCTGTLNGTANINGSGVATDFTLAPSPQNLSFVSCLYSMELVNLVGDNTRGTY